MTYILSRPDGHYVTTRVVAEWVAPGSDAPPAVWGTPEEAAAHRLSLGLEGEANIEDINVALEGALAAPVEGDMRITQDGGVITVEHPTAAVVQMWVDGIKRQVQKARPFTFTPVEGRSVTWSSL